MCCGNRSVACRHYPSTAPIALTGNLGSTQRAANSKTTDKTLLLYVPQDCGIALIYIHTHCLPQSSGME